MPAFLKLIRAAVNVEGFDGASFCRVAQLLLAAPHGAVGCSVLLRSIGMAMLDAMFRRNVLGLRPFNTWARDVPLEAFAAGDKEVRAARNGTWEGIDSELQLMPRATAPAWGRSPVFITYCLSY